MSRLSKENSLLKLVVDPSSQVMKDVSVGIADVVNHKL